MFIDIINKCAVNAVCIVCLLVNNLFGFWVSFVMVGVYVGFGIILIFMFGNLFDLFVCFLVMGVIFGIVLMLVIIVGFELFIGYIMFFIFGVKVGSISYG